MQPLAVPDQHYREIQMDFITDLPESNGNTCLWVVKDRLSKNVILEPMPSMEAELCAERFLKCFVRYHGWPRSIVSDRGSNWTSRFWAKLCELLGIKRLLSTAYHPQTDGGSERMNQEIYAYLRAVVNHVQHDWDKWCPMAQLAINSRINTSIGMTPFFATHGYDAELPISIIEEQPRTSLLASEKKAHQFVEKLQQITDLCQATMAVAAQEQEKYANQRRQPAERFQVGDKVWLDLKNYSTDRPKKKLDWLHAKYTISKVLSPHVVELSGLPRAMYNVFHVDLLRRAATDPLPGQKVTDDQPPAIEVEGELEFQVEEILCAKTTRRREGIVREVLVKWKGYQIPSWEPLDEFRETMALDKFEEKYGSADTNSGPIDRYIKEYPREDEETINHRTTSGRTRDNSRSKKKARK